MGVNPRRLMTEARRQFASSQIVSNNCCHPHYALRQCIDLKMARYLDEMATIVTGLPIRSTENHLNNHRDEYYAARN